MKKIDGVALITGGVGFIGSHLAHELSRHQKIVVVDRSADKKSSLTKDKAIEYISLDLGKTEELKKIIATYKPQTVHHCAGHTQLRAAIASPHRDAKDNILGTLSLIQSFIELKAEVNYLPDGIIFSSTAAVYGGYDTPPFSEHFAPLPTNPYGIAKVAAEQYLRWYGHSAGVPITIFRYANVYGSGQSTLGQAGVIASFMSSLVKEQPLKVYGDGSNTRDYIFVKDVVHAHYLAAKKHSNGTYNLGTGHPTSTLELAQLCTSLREKSELKLVNIDVEEQNNSWMNVGQVKKELEWEATTSLKDGLTQTYSWYRQQSTV